MSAVRVTNRDRVLLALAEAPSFRSRFELPQRVAQKGLVARLNMAQAHVSRALSQLIDDDLVVAERRRVSGERRRVNTYDLTAAGERTVEDLLATMETTQVLTPDDAGALVHHTYRDLLEQWRSHGLSLPSDALGLTEWLREAPVHDGYPLLEPPDGGLTDDDGPDDLASETITLLLELAELHRSSGRVRQATEHLQRAAELHRKRGSALGALRCRLAAASLGAADAALLDERHLVRRLRDPDERLEALLILHDLALRSDPSAAPELLSTAAAIDAGHPGLRVRHLAADPSAADAVARQALCALPSPWGAEAVLVLLEAALETPALAPTASQVEDAFDQADPTDGVHHPLLHARLVLGHLQAGPDDDGHRQRLERAWSAGLPLPVAGHVGFELASRQPPARARRTLDQLVMLFEADGDVLGAEVASERLERLDD